MKRKLYIVLFLILCILAQITFFTGQFSGRQQNTLTTILGGLMVLSCAFLYQFLIHVLKESRTSARLQALRKQKKLQEEQQTLLLEHQKESLAAHEKARGNLLRLQELLNRNDTEEAKALLASMTSEFEQNRFRPYCSDSLIHAILDEKRRIAERKNIQVQYEILLPEDYKISTTDLCTVLFNLLDNAVEACEASESPAPVIRLTIHTSGDLLSVYLHNSKNPEVKFQHKTTKSAASDHGFGLYIIEDICRKYDGSYQWLDRGEFFDSILMLKM